MKLGDLIKSNNWLSVQITLLQIYPDQLNMLDEYQGVFEKLKILDPTNYDLDIVLETYDCDSNFESTQNTYVDVSGRKKIPDPDAITDGYALEFLEWDKWLGMDLAEETIQHFSELEIIAHCLYEMTFVDFEEEAIQYQLKSLNDTIEEYKNLTDEEKNQKTTSFDDLNGCLMKKKAITKPPN